MHQNQNKHHIPVLLEEVLTYLDPKQGETYLDLTAGYGGHASRILERTLAPANAVLVDRDQNAVRALKESFMDNPPAIIRQDFLSATTQLVDQQRTFDIILADLGVSSPHLNNASRGFSLRLDGPLDMRMDQSQALTAEQIVNNYTQKQLVDIIRRYGEEPKAGRVAAMIIAARPILSTRQLADIMLKLYPAHRKVHPATRLFQGLRIAVNSELDQLAAALPLWVRLLAPGGRLAVISFHSLEDRLVKQCFSEFGGDRYDSVLRILTKQAVTSSTHELVSNPRARSAKLRAVVKINNKKGETHANSGKKPLPRL